MWQKLLYVTSEAESLKVLTAAAWPSLGTPATTLRKPGGEEERLHVGVLAPVLAEVPADSQHQPPNVSE